MPDVHVVPVELEALGGPLAQIGDLLGALVGNRRQVEQLADGSPSPALRAALAAFVERWELTLWHLGQDADDLGGQVRLAAIWYRYNEQRQVARFGTGPVAE